MKRFNRILCVINSYDETHTALTHALEIAESHQATLKVIVTLKKTARLFPLINNKTEIDSAYSDLVKATRHELTTLVKDHCKNQKVESEVLEGIAFIEIIREVLRFKPDLLVKCSHNESWLARIFGSNDMHLLRKCPCPVLMLKPGHVDACQNILATVDIMDEGFDEESEYRVQDELNELVLEYASVFALAESAEMHIGSVWDSFGENFLRLGAFTSLPEDKVNRYVEQTHQEYVNKLEALSRNMKTVVGEQGFKYLQPTTHLIKGLPAKEIPLMAHKYNIDLIVMGTVARTGIPGLIIGNTAEAILEQVQCSVLAIKPKDFKTPVTI